MIQLSDYETKLGSRIFIEKAFRALEDLLQSDEGKSNLRLRKGTCKKFIEEVLPIAAFLGCFERPGLDLYCQYFSGDQSFDAKIYCEGLLVEREHLKKEYSIESSIACHEKDYLKRECLEKGIPCFGGSDIERLPNGNIKSIPQVRTPDDLIDEHLNFIKSRIEKKSQKNYPDNTFLLIPLFPDTLIMQREWMSILEKLMSVDHISTFCGLFVYDSISQRKTLL